MIPNANGILNKYQRFRDLYWYWHQNRYNQSREEEP
jgi:hypothetical protein